MPVNIFKCIIAESQHQVFWRWLLSHFKNPTANPDITACSHDFLLEVVRQAGNIFSHFANNQFTMDVEPLPSVSLYNQQKLNDKPQLKLTDSAKNDYFIYIEFEPGQPVTVNPTTVKNTYDFKGMPLNDILTIFNPYKNKIDNPIFQDYLNFITGNSGVNLPPVIKPNPIITPSPVPPSGFTFPNKPFSMWSDSEYRAFFRHLIESQLVTGKIRDKDYGYNIKKDFAGIWWNEFPIKSIEHEIYLTIDKDHPNKINLKAQIIRPCDTNQLEKIIDSVMKFFQINITDFKQYDFNWKRAINQNKWLWIGYVEFDENNYAEQITKMNDTYDKWIQTLP